MSAIGVYLFVPGSGKLYFEKMPDRSLRTQQNCDHRAPRSDLSFTFTPIVVHCEYHWDAVSLNVGLSVGFDSSCSVFERLKLTRKFYNTKWKCSLMEIGESTEFSLAYVYVRKNTGHNYINLDLFHLVSFINNQ